MALCESQLDSALPQLNREESSPRSDEGVESPEKKPKLEQNGDIYGVDQVPAGLPLSVDYRSPVSHFVPPAVEMYAARHSVKSDQTSTADSNDSQTPPVKRKRGRPRVDKTSPEYIAKSAARKQAREIAALNNRDNNRVSEIGEKRKRGRPRVDKTSPEYLARKRARELEALERKAKREYKRRSTNDSAASSSAGDGTPRIKRKYTRRNPLIKKNDGSSAEKIKGKRGRPRKTDLLAANNARPPQQAKIRVRSNLMPVNSEPIPVDSDDEPDLGSPGASDSLSLDENLRALRHIHEKYANIDKDDLYGAHLLAANFKKPPHDQQRLNNRDDDEVLSIRSSEGQGSVKELDPRVEKLEDSSNSDSDSSSSGSGSSSSGSSSSSSSGSSSSSDSSDSESEAGDDKPKPAVNNTVEDDRSFGAWSYAGAENDSASDSDPERHSEPIPVPRGEQDEISESENESPDKSFQCHICRKWYSTRVTLKIHRRVHQNRGGGGNSRSRARSSDKYECDCCNETFNRREKLWEHKAEAHRGSMTVRCEVCRKCFEDDGELAAHDRTHTADERAGRCSECGASFQRYDQLRRHRACAHPNAVTAANASTNARLPHACQQCGKRFGHAHSLTRHMHNHAKQLYRCVVCKASFGRADQLAQHLNSHLANYKRLKP